ncbi:hypothetical protein TOPH_09103 [Tolypocladium ophioglossoides CBS 100239]|uniref:Uncharacterized protein n=1 Tax=Tolypocladium ophioglossoides (strain CBS 100239) TaxID=1163406 RepID=A0A0L0MWN2_TOLOC|nr:hypothetical protein TOPH_09103 [Tolypocladium ophioglossoides CBS 100239]
MDKHGRSMGVDPHKTRHQLARAGFTEVNESVIKVCYSPWSGDPHEREVARWFNAALRRRLVALSCAPLTRKLGMSGEDVEQLCDRVYRDMCVLGQHAYCRVYIWTAKKPKMNR